MNENFLMDAFKNYLEENDIDVDEDNIDDVFEEFMNVFKEMVEAKNEPETEEEKIAHLLHQARNEEDVKRARQLVKKALKMNPDHVSAKLLWYQLQDDSIQNIQPLLEMKEEALKHVEYYKIETGKTIDNYYLDPIGKDYLHILFDLCQTYQRCGMYKKALEVAKEGIVLDPMDHPNFHHDLLAICLHLENFEETNAFLKGYQVETPTCLLFGSMLDYKQGDLDKAKAKIEKICKGVPGIRRLLLQDKMSEKSIEKLMFSEQGDDVAEFFDVLQNYPFLFSENTYFDWLINVMKETRKRKKVKEENVLLN